MNPQPRVLLALLGALAGGCARHDEAPSAPLPDLAKGTAHVTSSPPGATIEVGGIPAKDVTPADVTVEVGRDNTLTVHRVGYLPASKVVNPDLNQVPQVHFELQPGATVSVTSEPPGAQVWLGDRVAVPATPGTVEALPEGIHLLRLKKDGFADLSHSLKITGQEPVSLTLKLLPAAYLKIETDPDGARIFVDGTDSGSVTPVAGLALAANAKHRIELRKDGFSTAAKAISAMRPGEHAEASFTLQELRLINVRARIKTLESDLRKWTAVRDRLQRKQEGNFVIRDAHKELALKRQLDEADEQVESISAELDSARDQRDALEESGTHPVKAPK